MKISINWPGGKTAAITIHMGMENKGINGKVLRSAEELRDIPLNGVHVFMYPSHYPGPILLFQLMKQSNYSISNLVLCIWCSLCGLQYIGQIK